MRIVGVPASAPVWSSVGPVMPAMRIGGRSRSGSRGRSRGPVGRMRRLVRAMADGVSVEVGNAKTRRHHRADLGMTARAVGAGAGGRPADVYTSLTIIGRGRHN